MKAYATKLTGLKNPGESKKYVYKNTYFLGEGII